MLTACCNVMSILLARGAFQAKEFALRPRWAPPAAGSSGRSWRKPDPVYARGLFGVLGQQALAFLLERLGRAIPRG